MEQILPLAALWLWSAAVGAGEPLSAAVRRRSDDGGVYARNFARRYEPAAFVGLSLHRPIPVLQLLTAPAPALAASAAPHHLPPIYAASMSHAWFAKPTLPAQREPVAESHSYYSKTKHPTHFETTSTWYGKKQHSETSSWYGQPSAADSSPMQPARYGHRLAARHPAPAPAATAASEPAWEEQPAPQDAPAYYSPPAEDQENVPLILYAQPTEQGGYKYRRRPAKPPKKADPIIIRIHKHRVVRDD